MATIAASLPHHFHTDPMACLTAADIRGIHTSDAFISARGRKNTASPAIGYALREYVPYACSTCDA
ncbi:hypothetical protein PG2022B_1539 [Bifidobacterium animalis subsp. animalis]|nr:hypothetical protein PG2022B_1539 [Bifidobacterium animalis subsp. animalis]